MEFNTLATLYKEIVHNQVTNDKILNPVATCRNFFKHLDSKIDYILSLTDYNGIRTHLSQHTIRIICVNAQVVLMTP